VQYHINKCYANGEYNIIMMWDKCKILYVHGIKMIIVILNWSHIKIILLFQSINIKMLIVMMILKSYYQSGINMIWKSNIKILSKKFQSNVKTRTLVLL
jgi:hypothetical protein